MYDSTDDRVVAQMPTNTMGRPVAPDTTVSMISMFVLSVGRSTVDPSTKTTNRYVASANSSARSVPRAIRLTRVPRRSATP